MTTKLRLNGSGDVEINSKSGKIIHVADTQFNHSADKNLADLKNISFASGDLVKFDGTMLVAQPESTYATAVDQSALSGRVDDLENGSTGLITSVSSPLAINDKVLSVDLSSYLTTADATTTYLAQADEYITSVSGALSVDGHQLTVDLSSKMDAVPSDIVINDSIKVVPTSNVFGSKKSSLKFQYLNGDQAVTSWALDANKLYKIDVSSVYHDNVNNKFGTNALSSLYRLVSGVATLISGSDTASNLCDCDGSEVTLDVSSATVSLNSHQGSTFSNACIVSYDISLTEVLGD